MEIRTGGSDSNSSRQESSSFDRVQRRSNESQYGRKKGSDVRRELEEKGINFFKKVQGETHTNKTNKRGPLIRSTPSSWSEISRRIKRSKKENIGKKSRREETVVLSTSGYNLRLRSGRRVQSRPTMEMKTQQGKAKEGTTVPTSKNKQYQATRIPHEDVINNKRTRKGKEERILAKPYLFRF
ncbi:uncharacterized protein TNCV_4228561 [Trichonephila clavipes]|nr:uncharacterized protein TNCV_4228561 [Trichonephila clavipes]